MGSAFASRFKVDGRDYDVAITSPERRLLAAIVERALADLRGQEHVRTPAKQDAISWFLSRSEDPFTFEWVCRELDLPAGALRALAETLFTGEKEVFRFNVGIRGKRRSPESPDLRKMRTAT